MKWRREIRLTFVVNSTVRKEMYDVVHIFIILLYKQVSYILYLLEIYYQFTTN